jgi:glycosyltransferase involved in cell wall biosynthesis
VLCGSLGWGTRIGEEAGLEITGYVTRERLRELYRRALAFVYPSHHEGFGIPPLEAMACGAPVITSRIPSLMETVGDAARLVNPEDVGDIARAMTEMLCDVRVREHYAELGKVHVKKFSWEQTARQTLEVYQQLHQKRRQD